LSAFWSTQKKSSKHTEIRNKGRPCLTNGPFPGLSGSFNGNRGPVPGFRLPWFAAGFTTRDAKLPEMLLR
jgi:hypothetical protein